MGVAGVEPWICAFHFLSFGQRSMRSVITGQQATHLLFFISPVFMPPFNSTTLLDHEELTRVGLIVHIFVYMCFGTCVGFSHVCMFNDINDNTAYPFHNSLCILLSSLIVMFLIAIHAACTQVTAENVLETDRLVLRSGRSPVCDADSKARWPAATSPGTTTTSSFCSSVFQDLQNQGILPCGMLFTYLNL